ncbi:MAG: hypothetical protein OEZ34_04930 [Spirochaetia bacterium]|nr:hypothetical protein [Spirochaetia bacterium]
MDEVIQKTSKYAVVIASSFDKALEIGRKELGLEDGERISWETLNDGDDPAGKGAWVLKVGRNGEFDNVIRNCSFEFECSMNWHELKLTADENIRFCNKCNENVYRISTDEELQECLDKRRCVALYRDHFFGGELVLGRPTVTPGTVDLYAEIPKNNLNQKQLFLLSSLTQMNLQIVIAGAIPEKMFRVQWRVDIETAQQNRELLEEAGIGASITPATMDPIY